LFPHWWAALDQGVILGRELSQDGPLLGSPEGENHVLDQECKILSAILEIDANSDTVSPETGREEFRESGSRRKVKSLFLGHNLSLPSPIERKEELGV